MHASLVKNWHARYNHHMNIGVDFDGVINTNNATAMAVLERAIALSLGYKTCKPDALNSQDRYCFTDKDYEIYQTIRHNQINSRQFFSTMQMMPGAVDAIKTLNDIGHHTYLVTVRGCDSSGKFDANIRRYLYQTLTKWDLINNGLRIDNDHSFFDPKRKQIDKVAQCKNLGIKLLIDDDPKNVSKMRQANYFAIHFGVEAKNWQAVIQQIEEIVQTP